MQKQKKAAATDDSHSSLDMGRMDIRVATQIAALICTEAAASFRVLRETRAPAPKAESVCPILTGLHPPPALCIESFSAPFRAAESESFICA